MRTIPNSKLLPGVSVILLSLFVNCSKPVVYSQTIIASTDECKKTIEQVMRETIAYDGTFQDVLVDNQFFKSSYIEARRGFFDVNSIPIPTQKFVYYNNVSKIELNEKSGWTQITIFDKDNVVLLDVYTRSQEKAKRFSDSVYTLSKLALPPTR